MSIHFDKLTAAHVADWARGTLEDGLEGWTMAGDDVPLQYRMQPQADDTWIFEPTPYPPDGWERPTQRFAIQIAVTEVQN
ncbi:hypothetical protein CFP71_13430 [Amycolatopsis thailandensis]|uniref:Uncharacterized protein n=1 Tax=Amycolatopsis thailandensis TaxID=589330 RepID=A0A229SCU4_9PSEU|nr:hypothetical protein [Amycolatopsis thailandensis]OXM56424.1 hypothetical protein CFP71_13430 [Amycolatopsis thailandensis]